MWSLSQLLSSAVGLQRQPVKWACKVWPMGQIWPVTCFYIACSPRIPLSQVVLVVKNLPANTGVVKRCGFNPWVRKIPWKRAWQPIPKFLPGEFLPMEKPGRLQSIGSQKDGHNWNNLLQHSQKWSLHFNVVENVNLRKIFMTSDNYMTFKFQCP